MNRKNQKKTYYKKNFVLLRDQLKKLHYIVFSDQPCNCCFFKAYNLSIFHLATLTIVCLIPFSQYTLNLIYEAY